MTGKKQVFGLMPVGHLVQLPLSVTTCHADIMIEFTYLHLMRMH